MRSLLLGLVFFLASAPLFAEEEPLCHRGSQLCFDSIAELSIGALRERQYSANFKLLSQRSLGEFPGAMLGFDIDDISQYARLAIPRTDRPEQGFPVVVFAHGWVGINGAPNFEFAEQGLYREMMDSYLAAGFAVLIPGFRGHGTVAGQPAEGLEFLEHFDNSSYLSPTFYAIDLLGSVQAIPSINGIHQLNPSPRSPLLDPSSVNLVAHSQGGDVALTALAIANNNRLVRTSFNASSIWSGCIADRFTQAETYGPMSNSREAFLSGDGTWTGSAVGERGEINPNFVFAWPADWIGTLEVDSDAWSWQDDTWKLSMLASFKDRYETMYQTLRDHFADLEDVSYQLSSNSDGKINATHHPRVAERLLEIGGFHQARRLSTPITFNISDRDYYSLPAWNLALTDRINDAGGDAKVNIYTGTTHGLGVSEHTWFSPEGTKSAVSTALAADIALFRR
ncbi:alpha/beta hydrolase family protein [Umboniibacter marinipuniceus]|uniref:Alpha/beta hydrolase family protein n=1 Tax=Umboniibacter marinipuniceus TaxID=569599 RepID=A0A3M0AD48_9GAMM|nr:alpha/beta fold hydrolase [Umboniibacter marinipuniceus]RMA82466.1 alpha/beta hydrolase family protein [Umboniibacter marinipuniceus]